MPRTVAGSVWSTMADPDRPQYALTSLVMRCEEKAASDVQIGEYVLRTMCSRHADGDVLHRIIGVIHVNHDSDG